MPANWRWSVLVVALASGRYPRWEAVAGACCTWWQKIAQGAEGNVSTWTSLRKIKSHHGQAPLLLAKNEGTLRILMQEECPVLRLEWPAAPCPWSFHIRKTAFLLVRRYWLASWLPPVRVAAMAFVWYPRRMSVNKGLSLTQDWRNGLFLLLQPDCVWNTSQVSGGYDGQGAIWYPVFRMSSSLAHWPQQLVMVLPFRNNFCIFYHFYIFLKLLHLSLYPAGVRRSVMTWYHWVIMVGSNFSALGCDSPFSKASPASLALRGCPRVWA